VSQILFYQPGQLATITLDITVNGVRSDGYDYPTLLPYVNRILFPSLMEAANYPQNMSRLDIGLYSYSFTLPQGAIAVGSYLADVVVYDPVTGNPVTILYQIVCTAPFGLYSATTT
jgi:hypothetical protein